MAKLMLWLVVVAIVVSVGTSSYYKPETKPEPKPEPEPAKAPSALLSGNLNVTGVGQLNGTTNPPTLCGSSEVLNATGCGYLTPNPHGNLTVGNVTIPVNITTPVDPINLP